MKILIVEDEKSLSDAMVNYLTEEDFICETAYDYESSVEKVELYEYDCALIDINLPDGNGLDLIRLIKKRNKNMGIIIISARNSLDNRIEGLEIGADYYLTKPFHLTELNAQLRSIHRRINFEGNNQIVINEIKILPDAHQVYVDDKLLKLTKKEYELMQFFAANRNKVITKTGIAEHLWGDYMEVADNYDFIYGHMKNLRKKLLDKGCRDYIKTIYGVGYKFDTTIEN
ncbi:response regulator transcription factor [Maribellus mangrovi]|uniref:response regulator transcription factor n=1 Tax=Maribellus mangrovi TaxID=3133146 RepID=UPI0030EC8285